jgi:hypothetical protein
MNGPKRSQLSARFLLTSEGCADLCLTRKRSAVQAVEQSARHWTAGLRTFLSSRVEYYGNGFEPALHSRSTSPSSVPQREQTVTRRATSTS